MIRDLKNGEAISEQKSDAKSHNENAASESYQLDCYPYTFSPLLLFAPDGYFDKGHSNYNSVAEFFRTALSKVNMLENVLYV